MGMCLVESSVQVKRFSLVSALFLLLPHIKIVERSMNSVYKAGLSCNQQ
jgi:hypothetical protein